MIRNDEIKRLAKVNDQYQAADALGLVLYGYPGARYYEFREAFLEAIEDSATSHWVEGRGQGPRAVGTLLGAVWFQRRET